MILGCPSFCHLDVLPLCFAIILVVCLVTSFTIAVCESHITPWFPAISDTVTKSPESNIFGQLLDIASFIGLILVYVRYLQVRRDIDQYIHRCRATVILNRWSLFFGLTANLGSSIVANFPETQVPIVHIIGSSIFFGFGNIYAWTQVAISYHMKQLKLISLCMCLVRFVLTWVSSTSFVVCTVTIASATQKWSGDNLFWHADNPGFKEHVVGDAFEWLMLFSFMSFLLTFTKEFSKSRIEINLVSTKPNYEPIVTQPKDNDK